MEQVEQVRKKILYVDDVSYSLISVKDRLRKRYEVYLAQSVSKMFDILEKVQPDLILLDVNMADVNGYEAIEMLKADERFSAIPVIFLTAQRDKESVIKGIHLGAVAHVGKPVSTPMLLEAIENVFNPGAAKGMIDEVDESDTSKARILCVDDVAYMLRAIHFALKNKYIVYTLSNSEEVEGFLKRKTPDLIILDYNMPVLSGFDLIPIIRGFPEHKETPIIFLTSEGTVDHLTAALHLGAADFIVKPFDMKALHKKIEQFLKKT